MASLPASATSVSVTGTGYLGNGLDGLSVTAGSFSASSATPGDLGPSFIGFGTVGVPMTFSWTAQAFSQSLGSSLVHIGTQVTDFLDGGIAFTPTFTIPASALVTGTFTTPATVSGSLQAFQDLTFGQGNITQGPLMASLLFTGTGTATFNIEDLGEGSIEIRGGFGTFSGTGTLQTVVPEPSSLFLMGSGLVSLAGIVRRKRSSLRPARKA